MSRPNTGGGYAVLTDIPSFCLASLCPSDTGPSIGMSTEKGVGGILEGGFFLVFSSCRIPIYVTCMHTCMLDCGSTYLVSIRAARFSSLIEIEPSYARLLREHTYN